MQSPVSDTVAFQLGPVAVRWYGLIIACALLAGIFVASRAARKRTLQPAVIQDLAFWCGISAILVARMYYVIFNWNLYSNNPVEIFAIWHGGLAIHGAIIGGLAAFLVYTYARSITNVWSYLDCMIFGLLTGQAIGRWGNFFNQEAFGAPTSLPWGLYIDPAHRPTAHASSEYFHPTFLYESLWNLIALAVLWNIDSRKHFKPGTIAALYCITYGIGRFWIEALRTDSLMLGPLRAAQVASIILVIVGSILLYTISSKPLAAKASP